MKKEATAKRAATSRSTQVTGGKTNKGEAAGNSRQLAQAKRLLELSVEELRQEAAALLARDQPPATKAALQEILFAPHPTDLGFNLEAQKVRPKTMRLEPANERGLSLLKETLGAPLNKMVNEAVSEYVARRTATLESNLSQVLERVKAQRRADPTFAKDLEAFVTSEAKHGAKDPLEGETYDVTPPARKKASAKTTKTTKTTKDHSALAAVRDILRG